MAQPTTSIMSLLGINPADFPDVPTRKALIAIDLQNDFLAEDGALPVKQPDGMVTRILELAQAMRNSGYGEVVWVRSQFDTSRAVGEQQIMTADTHQLPSRPGASATAAAAATAATARPRMSRASPAPSTPLEADCEAFLSVVGGQTASSKPQCVRKGTKGAELLPDIAAAKGPRDYAMTKSYYSAFQSGQLLNLLRRTFATELFICGALSNVSVYATALAASSYGFDITIVEDCCGYRSEMRHMNATRRLTELTGCEFKTAAEIIPRLRPKSPAKPDKEHLLRATSSPSQIPPELIAAAMAGQRHSPSRGIPVRSKPAPPSADPVPTPSIRSSIGEKKEKTRHASPPLLSPSPPDLAASMERLKLSAAESAGPADVSDSAPETGTAKIAAPEPEAGPTQPQAKQAVQPVVKDEGAETEDEDVPTCANAQEPKADLHKSQTRGQKKSGAQGIPGHESPSSDGNSRGVGQRETESKVAVAAQINKDRLPTRLNPKNDDISASPQRSNSKPTQFVLSEELLTAETPEDILKVGWPVDTETMPANRDQMAQSPPDATANPHDRETEASKDKSIQKGEETDSTAVSDSGVNDTTLTTSEPLCEGDTTVIYNFLPSSLLDGLFERLCVEVAFKRMMHQGGEVPRFVAVQGEVAEDGTQPIYRHPSDETLPLVPFTPAVQRIREQVERRLGHMVNHVLIQCYRGGNDYISEHSDKTLDIVHGSYIANVSLGAARTMAFRTKRGDRAHATGRETTPYDEMSATTPETEDRRVPAKNEETLTAPSKPPAPESTSRDTPTPSKRQTTRAQLPHNSLLRMGLVTNAKWLHGIRPDKRPQLEKSAPELAWDGVRISLTFRHIGTFLSYPPSSSPFPSNPSSSGETEPLIWGQGATSKFRAGAQPVINGQTPDAVAMLRAFGRENNLGSDFDWESHYGTGFDVLHMSAAPRYFGCGDVMIDGRVKIMLAECGVKYAHGHIGVGSAGTKGKQGVEGNSSGVVDVIEVGEYKVVPAKFVLDDAARTTVVGDVAILLWLDARYPRRKKGDADLARVYTRLHAAVALGQRWKSRWARANADVGNNLHKRSVISRSLKSDLGEFDAWAAESDEGHAHGAICGGVEPSIADYALWPVLHDMATAWEGVAEGDGGARGFRVTLRETMGYTALERYYADFARRKSVTTVFGNDVVSPSNDTKESGRDDEGEGADIQQELDDKDKASDT